MQPFAQVVRRRALLKGDLRARGWCNPAVRVALILLVALVALPAAQAKELTTVLVVGPRGPTFFEPYDLVKEPLGRLRPGAPPSGGYVLVFPLMRGIPARPGRWFPHAGVLCSGWRSGIEAGCASAPRLRGFLGSGVATGVFRREPVRLTSLRRAGRIFPRYGNEAAAVKLALYQRGSRAMRASLPAHCLAFTARWTQAGWPESFCVGRRGLYASGRLYPLPPATAAFLRG
jgi:hypothetical protein